MKTIEVRQIGYSSRIVAGLNGILNLTKVEREILCFLLDETTDLITKEIYQRAKAKSGYKTQYFSNVIRRLEKKKIIIKKGKLRTISVALSSVVKKGEIKINFK
jgi:predicted transcriptional regulator